jgi:jasmonate O-methyltransferase
MIDKAKLDSFYIPVYGPSAKELRVIIEEEGSFSITEMQTHDCASGMDRAHLTPNRIANTLRAVFEPIIVQHFGEIMDEFVRTGEKHLNLQRSSRVEGTKHPIVMVLVSLTKA